MYIHFAGRPESWISIGIKVQASEACAFQRKSKHPDQSAEYRLLLGNCEGRAGNSANFSQFGTFIAVIFESRVARSPNLCGALGNQQVP